MHTLRESLAKQRRTAHSAMAEATALASEKAALAAARARSKSSADKLSAQLSDAQRGHSRAKRARELAQQQLIDAQEEAKAARREADQAAAMALDVMRASSRASMATSYGSVPSPGASKPRFVSPTGDSGGSSPRRASWTGRQPPFVTPDDTQQQQQQQQQQPSRGGNGNGNGNGDGDGDNDASGGLPRRVGSIKPARHHRASNDAAATRPAASPPLSNAAQGSAADIDTAPVDRPHVTVPEDRDSWWQHTLRARTSSSSPRESQSPPPSRSRSRSPVVSPRSLRALRVAEADGGVTPRHSPDIVDAAAARGRAAALADSLSRAHSSLGTQPARSRATPGAVGPAAKPTHRRVSSGFSGGGGGGSSGSGSDADASPSSVGSAASSPRGQAARDDTNPRPRSTSPRVVGPSGGYYASVDSTRATEASSAVSVTPHGRGYRARASDGAARKPGRISAALQRRIEQARLARQQHAGVVASTPNRRPALSRGSSAFAGDERS